jgi:large subunit ribosomal protein L22
MSPRKVRLVVNAVRGMKATAAETRLSFMSKGAALPVLKLLQSAMANAEHNFKLDRHDLTIAKITADGGPMLKRWRARAFGRAAPIRKRTTHITLILTDGKSVATAAPAAEKKAAIVKPKVTRVKKAKAAAKPKATR